MNQQPETLTRHELVGLPVAVTAAANDDLVGIEGRVIRETTRTLVIRPDPTGDAPLGAVDERPRRVPKSGTTFAFRLADESVVSVYGDRLIARPARRTETTGGSLWV